MSNVNGKGSEHENNIHELKQEEEQKVTGGNDWVPPNQYVPPPQDPFIPDREAERRCIVTSATMQIHHGKDDNCDELQTFRKYRDTYLVNQPDGNDLLKEYYEIAPLIVNSINAKHDHKEIYAKFWNEVLEPCLEMMKNGKNEEVKAFYMKSVNELKKAHL